MDLSPMWKRCIITGSVSSGKTTLVEALRKFPNIWVIDEEATNVIRQQLANGGSIFPWTNPVEFSRLVTHKAVISFDEAPVKFYNCIFDRGVPDSIAFLKMDGIEPEQELIELAKTHIYDISFWAPPWREIFENSLERPQNWEYSEKIGLLLRDVYTSIGYNIIELPRVDTLERAKFVMKHLHRNC